MHIGKQPIGLANKPFIVAEMSGNHNQSLDRALEIVQAAAESGAHALKLQTYTADTITLDVNDGDFFIDDRFGSFAYRPLNFNFITKMAPPIRKVAKFQIMIGTAFSRNP